MLTYVPQNLWRTLPDSSSHTERIENELKKKYDAPGAKKDGNHDLEGCTIVEKTLGLLAESNYLLCSPFHKAHGAE